MTMIQEAPRELGGSVIGVGHLRRLLAPLNSEKEVNELIRQGAPRIRAPEDTRVNPCRHGNVTDRRKRLPLAPGRPLP